MSERRLFERPTEVWVSGPEVGAFRVVVVPDAINKTTKVEDPITMFVEMRATPDAMGHERWIAMQLGENSDPNFRRLFDAMAVGLTRAYVHERGLLP